MKMTPEQMRSENPILASSNYRNWLAVKVARDLVQFVMAPAVSAVAGYSDELHHALDASSVYLGPGR